MPVFNLSSTALALHKTMAQLMRITALRRALRQASAAYLALPAQQPQRNFHVSPPQLRDHHFDTLKFVQRLQGEGFSEEQARSMMKVLNDVIEESIQNLTR